MSNLHHLRHSFALNQREKDGPYYLRMRVYTAGSKTPVCLNLGFTVNPDRWDERRQRCTPRSFHGPKRIPAAVIDREIDRYEEAVNALDERYALEDDIPDLRRLRSDLRVQLGLEEATDIPTVGVALHMFIREQSSLQSWSSATVQKFRQLRTNLQDFGGMPVFEEVNRVGVVRLGAQQVVQGALSHGVGEGALQGVDGVLGRVAGFQPGRCRAVHPAVRRRGREECVVAGHGSQMLRSCRSFRSAARCSCGHWVLLAMPYLEKICSRIREGEPPTALTRVTAARVAASSSSSATGRSSVSAAPSCEPAAVACGASAGSGRGGAVVGRIIGTTASCGLLSGVTARALSSSVVMAARDFSLSDTSTWILNGSI